MPVYIVKDGKTTRLVDAKTNQAARAWASRNMLTVEKASSHETHKLALAGVSIEHATLEDDKP